MPARASLQRISEVAEQSARLVDGISRSTNDQVVATQDLVRAMQQISTVSHLTHEGTARARESIRAITQGCERLRRLSTPEGAPLTPPAAANGPHRPSRRPPNSVPLQSA